MNIFIGCTSEMVDDKYLKRSLELITELARLDDLNLVFGAYYNGLMGKCYDVFKNHDKKVCGVTLNIYKSQLDEMEIDETILVETSMDRMREIYNKSDILLFLPGGIGTYTEILSAVEEHRTKEDNKHIIIFNDDFFYTPLIKELYWMYEKKFSKKSIGEYVRIESKEEEIVEVIKKEIELWKN